MFSISQSRNERGAAAIMSMLWVAIIALAIVSTGSVLALGDAQLSRSSIATEQTFQAAESGLNRALYELTSDSAPRELPPLSVGGVSVTVKILAVSPPEDPFRRLVVARAEDPTGKVRTLELQALTNSFAQSLDYAVYSGTGGLEMENNTEVYGDVYSNGNILGSTGANPQGIIYGNAWTAGLTTDKVIVRPYAVTSSAGDLHAHDVRVSKVAGTVEYETIDSYTTSHAGAVRSTNPGPDVKAFPITDAMIGGWTNEVTSRVTSEIAAGSGQTLSANTIINTDTTWTNATKIDGDKDLTVNNNVTLIVQDSLWVTGKLMLQNGARVILSKNAYVHGDVTLKQGSMLQLAAIVGENDGVLIVDGTSNVENGVIIQGSGNAKSSLLYLSTNTSLDTANPAIFAANTSTGVLYYATHGKITVGQNGELHGTLADTIHLLQNSVVRYDPNLTILYVPTTSTPTAGVVSGSWQEQ